MADKYCSTCFRTGEELDAALTKALECNANAERAESAAQAAEDALKQTQETMTGAVLHTAQTLTDEQKAQARENIGAASSEEVGQALQGANTAFESINTSLSGLGEAVEKLQKVATSVDLTAFESEGVIVETYADGSTITYTMEFDESGNPTKITDSNGNVTVLTW